MRGGNPKSRQQKTRERGNYLFEKLNHSETCFINDSMILKVRLTWAHIKLQNNEIVIRSVLPQVKISILKLL